MQFVDFIVPNWTKIADLSEFRNKKLTKKNIKKFKKLLL